LQALGLTIIHLVLPNCRTVGWLQKRACTPDQGSKSLMSSHPGPQRRISGGLFQIPCQVGMSSKSIMEHWWIQFTFCRYWFKQSLILLAIQYTRWEVLVTRILNQTTRGQTLWKSIHSKQSGRSSLALTTFLQTKYAHEHFKLLSILHIEL